MASNLDLQEQEQIDELKAWWSKYGNLVTAVLTLALLAFAGWNGLQWWERRQATQAAALLDEVDRVLQTSDAVMAQRAFNDMKDRFPKTQAAQQAGLQFAQFAYNNGKVAESESALQWVAQASADPGLAAIARLRLAGIQMEGKRWDEAGKTLAGEFPPSMKGLVADRLGDLHQLQGQKEQAVASYKEAYIALPASDYRRLIAVKLAALGEAEPAQP